MTKKKQRIPDSQLSMLDKIEKLENWEHIRRAEINGEMHYSILDIFKFYGDTTNYRQEWQSVQKRLIEQGFDSSIKNIQLHQFEGERQRPTPVTTREVFFRIAQSTNFKNWEHIRRAMSQALDEKIESEVQRKMLQTINYYESVGWGSRPEILTLKGKYAASQSLIEVKGAISELITLTGYEWADFFGTEIQSLLGYAISEVKKARNTKSVRDSLNALEYNALVHAESDLVVLLSLQKTMDSRKLLETVRMVFVPMGKNLQSMLENLGYDALSGLPLLPSGEKR